VSESQWLPIDALKTANRACSTDAEINYIMSKVCSAEQVESGPSCLLAFSKHETGGKEEGRVGYNRQVSQQSQRLKVIISGVDESP
jgi:hypothetical protein